VDEAWWAQIGQHEHDKLIEEANEQIRVNQGTSSGLGEGAGFYQGGDQGLREPFLQE
jgi:hypothetical protein